MFDILTIAGAITLQGPHQVAMQSMTMRPGPERAESKSDLLWEEGALVRATLVGRFEGRGGKGRGGGWDSTDIPGKVVYALLCGSHLCCCSLKGFDLCLIRKYFEGCSRCR